MLRAAARALVPLVGVQTGDPDARLPTSSRRTSSTAARGRASPSTRSRQALARVLRRDGPVLAGSLPVLRDPVESAPTVEGAVRRRSARRARPRRHRTAPAAVSQAQMLSDLATARGRRARPEAPARVARRRSRRRSLALSLATSAVVRPVARARSRCATGCRRAPPPGSRLLGLAALFRRVAARLP